MLISQQLIILVWENPESQQDLPRRLQFNVNIIVVYQFASGFAATCNWTLPQERQIRGTTPILDVVSESALIYFLLNCLFFSEVARQMILQ